MLNLAFVIHATRGWHIGSQIYVQLEVLIFLASLGLLIATLRGRAFTLLVNIILSLHSFEVVGFALLSDLVMGTFQFLVKRLYRLLFSVDPGTGIVEATHREKRVACGLVHRVRFNSAETLADSVDLG